SGFFISPDGYIVTNNHVVDTAQKITVRTADQRQFTAKVVGRDAATDLAVLKIDARDMPYVSFEDAAKPRVGDWVVAVGNPFGLGGTATAGIVSALNRKNVGGSGSYVDYLQIDAPINPGNSGGPTFDLNGRVVGINSAIYSNSGGSVGIGFDIPADVAAQVTRQLISDGRVVRGYIGATVQDVTQEIADSLGVAPKGALVAGIDSGGPAGKAGLESGDIVLKVDGGDVVGASDLTRRIGLAKAGSSVRLDVRRDGKPVTLTVRTGERPAEDQLASASSRVNPRPALGLSLGADPNGRGVRVEAVAPGSQADDKGIEAGDVILRAGSQTARSPQDVASAVSSARADGRSSILLLVARDGRQTFVPLDLGQG
ncbi:MAG: htrA, partial [Caulobacteraceae bacterium]|nr:htrA [Caulobacteraceae bacterium]